MRRKGRRIPRPLLTSGLLATGMGLPRSRRAAWPFGNSFSPIPVTWRAVFVWEHMLTYAVNKPMRSRKPARSGTGASQARVCEICVNAAKLQITAVLPWLAQATGAISGGFPMQNQNGRFLIFSHHSGLGWGKLVVNPYRESLATPCRPTRYSHHDVAAALLARCLP